MTVMTQRGTLQLPRRGPAARQVGGRPSSADLARLLRRCCWQMLAPPHSLHLFLMRWCWQRLAPPHSLHWLLSRWCWQMLAPPHSLHLLLRRRPLMRVLEDVLAAQEEGLDPSG